MGKNLKGRKNNRNAKFGAEVTVNYKETDTGRAVMALIDGKGAQISLVGSISLAKVKAVARGTAAS